MLIVVMMGKWSNDSGCSDVQDVRLYSVLETVVIFVVVWGLALWFVFSVMWSGYVADDICY